MKENQYKKEEEYLKGKNQLLILIQTPSSISYNCSLNSLLVRYIFNADTALHTFKPAALSVFSPKYLFLLLLEKVRSTGQNFNAFVIKESINMTVMIVTIQKRVNHQMTLILIIRKKMFFVV